MQAAFQFKFSEFQVSSSKWWAVAFVNTKYVRAKITKYISAKDDASKKLKPHKFRKQVTAKSTEVPICSRYVSVIRVTTHWSQELNALWGPAASVTCDQSAELRETTEGYASVYCVMIGMGKWNVG
jgi:hypothetical protein